MLKLVKFFTNFKPTRLIYKFDAEYADNWMDGFGEILDQIIEYIDVYLQ